MVSFKTITKEEFANALARYPVLIKSISDSKKPNETKETLEQLDEFRFKTAPERYSSKGKDGKPIPLKHEDVVKLVTWKLKHGKFRPNLLKLSSSNAPSLITSTSLSAFSTYNSNSSQSLSARAIQAVKILATLSGIGPATASLLLSVHDPARIVFFGDEVFRWICCSGRNDVIKYNLKEYESLVQGSEGLMERLGVEAWEVEMVGFVMGREEENGGVKARGDKAMVAGKAKVEKDVVVESRSKAELKKSDVDKVEGKEKKQPKKAVDNQTSGAVEKRKMVQEEDSSATKSAKRRIRGK